MSHPWLTEFSDVKLEDTGKPTISPGGRKRREKCGTSETITLTGCGEQKEESLREVRREGPKR